MNPTQELKTIQEELTATQQKLEQFFYMYKQFKMELLKFCNENNGGSNSDNYYNIIDVVNTQNNIDKQINFKENIDDWVKTNYWDCMINDKENSTLPLAKEDMLDESDNLFNAELFDGENVKHWNFSLEDGSDDSYDSSDDVMSDVH